MDSIQWLGSTQAGTLNQSSSYKLEVPRQRPWPLSVQGHIYCKHAGGLWDERIPLTVKLPDFC